MVFGEISFIYFLAIKDDVAKSKDAIKTKMVPPTKEAPCLQLITKTPVIARDIPRNSVRLNFSFKNIN